MEIKEPTGKRGRDPDSGKFIPGWKGGPGRPTGSSRRDEYKALLEAKTPQVLKKLLDLAVEGDLTAIKLVLDRMMPVQSMVVEELQQQIEEIQERLECHPSAH